MAAQVFMQGRAPGGCCGSHDVHSGAAAVPAQSAGTTQHAPEPGAAQDGSITGLKLR